MKKLFVAISEHFAITEVVTKALIFMHGTTSSEPGQLISPRPHGSNHTKHYERIYQQKRGVQHETKLEKYRQAKSFISLSLLVCLSWASVGSCLPAAAPPDSTHLCPLSSPPSTSKTTIPMYLSSYASWGDSSDMVNLRFTPFYAYLLYQYIRADDPKRKQSLDQVYPPFQRFVHFLARTAKEKYLELLDNIFIIRSSQLKQNARLFYCLCGVNRSRSCFDCFVLKSKQPRVMVFLKGLYPLEQVLN